MKLHETLEEDDNRYIRESQDKPTLIFYVGKSRTIKLILPFSCKVNAIWNKFPEHVNLHIKTFYVFYILTNKMY
jgi:hypothetical protein